MIYAISINQTLLTRILHADILVCQSIMTINEDRNFMKCVTRKCCHAKKMLHSCVRKVIMVIQCMQEGRERERDFEKLFFQFWQLLEGVMCSFPQFMKN